MFEQFVEFSSLGITDNLVEILPFVEAQVALWV